MLLVLPLQLKYLLATRASVLQEQRDLNRGLLFKSTGHLQYSSIIRSDCSVPL